MLYRQGYFRRLLLLNVKKTGPHGNLSYILTNFLVYNLGASKATRNSSIRQCVRYYFFLCISNQTMCVTNKKYLPSCMAALELTKMCKSLKTQMISAKRVLQLRKLQHRQTMNPLEKVSEHRRENKMLFQELLETQIRKM